MKEHDFALMRYDVEQWARTHCIDAMIYGAPSTYWRQALYAGIITKEQYHYAASHYGDMWDYTGD